MDQKFNRQHEMRAKGLSILVLACAVVIVASQGEVTSGKPKDIHHHWEMITDQFDHDKDGVVHEHEIEEGVRIMLKKDKGASWSDNDKKLLDEIKSDMLKKYDGDGSGHFHKEEMMATYKPKEDL
jgi:hypothetical protein